MEYGILGPFRLVGSDGQEHPTTARQRDLLALLVLHRGQVLGRESLIDALWGQDLPDNPGNAVQQRIFHVRKLLTRAGAGDVLVTAPAGYRLTADPDQVDAARFERLLADGQRALRAADPHTASAVLGRALDQWRGPALQDVTAPWAAVAGEQLDELRLSCVQARIEAELRLGRHDHLLGELDGLVRRYPLREGLAGQLIRALALAGRQADALAAYERLRTVLAEELGLDPSAELQRLHRDVLTQQLTGEVADTGGAAPAAAVPPVTGSVGTVSRPAAQLPAASSSFVGREHDLARLWTRITTDRLVTVTGPGGAGKTRLVIEALRAHETELGATFGGVVFVDLSGIVEPAAVPTAVAAAAEVTGPVGAPALALLQAALAARPALLVLDSCEHLIDPVCELVALLTASCPKLRVLATSREPLGVDGEVVWPLDTLPVPAEDCPDLATALASPAGRLLIERSRAAAADLEVGDDDVAAVVRITRELDGLPLAIELAAARARIMSLSEIADRLTDRFALLAGGRRSAPARHRALTATLDWSWDLLTAAERQAWMAAAVPAAPFTLDLLATLLEAAAPGLDPVDAVAVLCERSLLLVESRGTPTRYRMLSSLREYGLARLAASASNGPTRSAHADAVELALLATDRMTPQRWSVDLIEQRRWLSDVRAAMRWRASQGDRLGVQRLAAGIGWMAYLTVLTAEGLRLLDEALGPLEEVDPDRVDPRAVMWAAGLRVGEAGPDGLAWARLAAEMVDRTEDPVQRGMTLGFLATFLVLDGQIHEALELIRAELPGARGWVAGVWRLLEGKLLLFLGDLDRAEVAVSTAVEEVAAAGAASAMLAGDVLVHIEQLRGDLPAMRAAAERSIRACQEHQAREPELEVRCLLAMAEAAAGDPARAEAELARSLEIAEQGGLAMVGAMVGLAEGYVHFRAGRLPDAEDAWTRALALHDWTGLIHGRPFMLWGRARVALARGDDDAAAEWCRQAFLAAAERGDRDSLAAALEGAAEVAVRREEFPRAAELLGAAAALRRAMGAPGPLVTDDLAQRTRTVVAEQLGADVVARAESGAHPSSPEALLAHLPD